MATEFKLSFTGSEINDKLGKIDRLAEKSELPTKISDLTNDSDFATKEYIDNAVSNAAPTPNWNASEGENGYIENRTHYSVGTGEEIYSGTVNIRRVGVDSLIANNVVLPIEVNKMYTVLFDGVYYEAKSYIDTEGYVNVGALYDDEMGVYDFTTYPFVIYTNSSKTESAVGADTAGKHTFTIIDGVVHKLDEKFIPDSVAKVDTASVGQTIVVEEVDANGKPTKWKAAEYQEKICGIKEVVVLPETTLAVEDSAAFSELDDIYVAGKEYKVTFNGEEYVCTAVDIGGVAAIGNVDILMDTGDNGMPFASLWEEGLGFLVFDGSTSITVSVIEVNYIPIPVEYMPIKPYYYEVNRADLSNYSDGMYTADLAEIPMALLKASCEKMPIYLKVNYLWSNTTESVELPAVFVFPGLDALMAGGYFDAYDEVVPSSEVSGWVPTLYARGLDGNTGIFDYYIRFVDGS